MRKTNLFARGAASALVLSYATSAAAQQTGFAIDRFEPAERGSQFFVVDNLDVRGKWRPALGAGLDYGYKPLVVYDRNGEERAAIVRHQMWAHLGGSIVVADRLRLGLSVPVAVYQDGEPSTVNGTSFKPSDAPAMGDVRLAADVRLLGQKTTPFTLAAGVRAWLPTGPREQFAGDGAFRGGPQVLAAGDLGLLTYAARVALVYRARSDSFGGSDLGSELTGSVGAGVKAQDGRLVIGPELFASSVFTGEETFLKTRSTPVEGLFGIHYDVTKDIRVGAGAGTGLTRGYGSPVVRGLFSFEWAPAYTKPDRDRDAIPDDVDACPDVAGERSPDPAKNGCPPVPLPPPPPLDSDEDGVVDKEDACITVPGVRTSDPKTNGCPDADRDGIVDAADACPNVAGLATRDPKTNGCPPDRDGDGVADTKDACPDVKGVPTDDPKTNGCPADTDGDGILDADDACPKLAGPKNADPKKNGCPLVIVTEKAIQITEQVKFKFNSAELLKESDTILEAVRGVLTDHAEITKLRVEGHTDDVGSAAYNKALSTRRAASVAKWLTDHGVNQGRLVAAGFGSEEPVDINTTEAGRANNRRVAFTIVEKDDSKKRASPAPGAP